MKKLGIALAILAGMVFGLSAQAVDHKPKDKSHKASKAKAAKKGSKEHKAHKAKKAAAAAAPAESVSEEPMEDAGELPPVTEEGDSSNEE